MFDNCAYSRSTTSKAPDCPYGTWTRAAPIYQNELLCFDPDDPEDLQGLMKYMSSMLLNDTSQDRGNYGPLVHRLRQNIDKRKVREYGYFAYA